MKKIWLIAFILLLPFVQAEDYFDYQTLDLQFIQSNEVTIQPDSSNYQIDYVSAELKHFPQNSFRQDVQSISTQPLTQLEDDIIPFYWNSPGLNMHFSVNSHLTTSAEIKQITQKEPFPVRSTDNALSQYTQKGDIIDINDDIRNLASSLVAGSDDLYEATFRLGDWTKKNIEYNLSTLNIEASQKASYVLETRQGVCDELTSLFISMCRSLGIPARFVSGIAYTNADYFEDSWGSHGWAEVYFPSVGWVPYDVTYGQLGYIDAGHIKLKDSIGPKEASVTYEYRGRNINLALGELDTTTTVLSNGGPIDTVVNINIDMYQDKIGFGSYNLITAHVRNTKPFYISEEITLARTTGVTVLDSYRKALFLKPGETKKLHWIVKVDENLDARNIYTFPVHLHTSRNQLIESSFQSQSGFPFIAYEDLEALIAQEELDYFEDISLLCEPDDYEVYYYKEATIRCALQNKGAIEIEDLEVCLDESCESYNMKGIKEINFVFQKSFSDLGLKTLPITAKADLFSKTNYVVVNVVDEPALYIDEINTPEKVGFDEKFSIDFTLRRKSSSFPRNVQVHLDHPVIRYDWDFQVLENNQRFVLDTEGKMLGMGTNTFTLDISFEDAEGNVFNQSEQFYIELEDLGLMQKGFVIGNKLGVDIERILTNKEDSDRFFKSPKTWIIFGVIVMLLIIMKIVLLIERKKGHYIPGPGMPKN